jgi:thiol-disulfide isomerase/thioredoxin
MRRVTLIVLVAALAFSAGAPKADLNLQDASGHKVTLRDLRGKPVVLNFWATWCEPCRAEKPMLVERERQYAARGVQFIPASLDAAKTKARIPAFLAEHHVEFPVWVGASSDDFDKLHLGNAVPATAFLDADGHIVARILGQARPEEPLVKHLK